jgi:hypothetical protein
LADSLEDVLPVLVKLELDDLDLGGRDSDRYRLAVALLAADALDVDNVFETVDGSDFALATLVGSTLNDDLVIFADRDGFDLSMKSIGARICVHGDIYVVLFPEFCPIN